MSHRKQTESLSILICMLNNCLYLNCHTVNDTNRLLKDKLTDYNRNTRPTVNQSTPTVVKFEFDLNYIQEFNEVQQRLETLALLNLQWTDEIMRWNPADYGGMYSVLTESGPFWIPNLILINSAEKPARIGDSWQTIRFGAEGTAYYYSLEMISSICVADITLYPWDVHFCYLTFMPQGYRPNEMNITVSKNKVGTSYFIENGAWELLDSKVEASYFTYYSYVTVMFLLERKPRYVIVNVILPIIFMAFLSTLVFLIPPDSGERISYSITVLLAIAVFLTIVGDILPKTSNPMSYFSYFLMAMLVTSVCITVCTIVNLRIYHSDHFEPVNRFWATIATCMKCGRKPRSETRQSKYNAEQFTKARRNGSIPDDIAHHENRERYPQESGIYSHAPEVYLAERHRRQADAATVKPESNAFSDSSESGNTITWKDVSVALDRITFVLFSAVILAAVVVYVVIASTGERVKITDAAFNPA